MKLTINELFSDNMVLQRDVEINVFGNCAPGATVRVSVQNQRLNATVNGDRWEVAIGPFKTSFQEEMVIESGGQTIRLENVAIGDVFLLAGQSNIEFEFFQCSSFVADLPYCSNDEIRYLEIPRIEYQKNGHNYPDLKMGSWQPCTKETAPGFSAIGLYFAHYLNREENIPIGLISMNKGGSSASCWISQRYLEKDGLVYRYYWHNYYNDIQNQSDEQEDEARRNYNRILSEYLDKVQDYQKLNPDKSLSELKKAVGHTPWPPPKGKKDAFRPAGLYETMFSRIKDCKVKSVIYYQGEEDTRNGEIYDRLLGQLIDNWRDDFNWQVPFIIVALPEYNDDKNDKWPLVRANQAKVCEQYQDTHLVVSLNCGEEFNIHPQDKLELAYRVFAMAKEAFYDTSFIGHAPVIVDKHWCKDVLVLEFDQEIIIAGPVKISVDGIGCESVQADGNRIIIPINVDTRTVGYCQENYCKSNIFSIDGLPIGGFIIDLAALDKGNPI